MIEYDRSEKYYYILDVDKLYACKELNMMWMRILNELDAWTTQSKQAVVCKKIKI